ncbi:MAG TPA: SpvB/TcaC N-terminal domain-containing protein, partial [bacterium]|nr:SpvB/TcaC N-terminal domain-containing protein [bacterium]
MLEDQTKKTKDKTPPADKTSTPETKSPDEKNFAAAPTLSLPKGGGAIRDIGEKFDVSPTTGTASFSVPIATSPGRSGFGPQLSLAYNSGSGNGPFGLGWSLSVPSITRKTEKGLPRYDDAQDSDIFILSGSEDLVPVFDWNGTAWSKNPQTVSSGEDTYSVQRYRPRVEGLFARIEKWTNQTGGDTYWKAITKDNVTSIYGKDVFGTDLNTRIADPSDSSRIFKWLLAETYDDKGNWTAYQYVPEDSSNVDLTQANEANRTAGSRSANRYLKNIFYGNRVSHLTQTDPTQAQWMFQVVFDYGEGQYSENPPDANGNIVAQASATISAGSSWPARLDPFSTLRSCFEVRTYRLCQRVLMFHLFSELGVNPCLVRSTEFAYSPGANLTTLNSATQNGFTWQGTGTGYLKKSMPPLLFTYIEPVIDPNLHFVQGQDLENLPEGLDGKNYEWIDLDSEGPSGILNREPDGWYYKHNLSALPVTAPDGTSSVSAHFAPTQLVLSQPGFSTREGQLMDLAGDGRKSLVQFKKPVPGFLERTEDGGWEPFMAFRSHPNLD